MSISFKLLLLFIGTFELISSLFIMNTSSDCITAVKSLGCTMFSESTRTLAVLLVFSSIVTMATNSFTSTRREISIILKLLSTTPLILIGIASWGYGFLPKAIVFFLMAIFTIFSLFASDTNISNKKYHSFPFFISVVLITTSLAFFFTPNPNLSSFKLLSLIAFLIGTGIFAISAQTPQKYHNIFALLSVIALQLLSFQGILENSFMMLLFPLLASFFCLLMARFYSLFSHKEEIKQNIALIKPMQPNAPGSCTTLHRFLSLSRQIKNPNPVNKVFSEIERIIWVTISVIIIVLIFSPNPNSNAGWAFTIIGIGTLVTAISFNFLIYDICHATLLIGGIILYNVLALLMISTTGGFYSSLTPLPVIMLIATTAFLGKDWIILPLMVDLGFFTGFLLLAGSGNPETSIWFLFYCLILILVSMTIYQSEKLKQVYAKHN